MGKLFTLAEHKPTTRLTCGGCKVVGGRSLASCGTGSAMWLVSELTAPGVALILPAPLDTEGLLRAFAALIVACVVATLFPR